MHDAELANAAHLSVESSARRRVPRSQGARVLPGRVVHREKRLSAQPSEGSDDRVNASQPRCTDDPVSRFAGAVAPHGMTLCLMRRSRDSLWLATLLAA